MVNKSTLKKPAKLHYGKGERMCWFEIAIAAPQRTMLVRAYRVGYLYVHMRQINVSERDSNTWVVSHANGFFIARLTSFEKAVAFAVYASQVLYDAGVDLRKSARQIPEPDAALKARLEAGIVNPALDIFR